MVLIIIAHVSVLRHIETHSPDANLVRVCGSLPPWLNIATLEGKIGILIPFEYGLYSFNVSSGLDPVLIKILGRSGKEKDDSWQIGWVSLLSARHRHDRGCMF